MKFTRIKNKPLLALQTLQHLCQVGDCVQKVRLRYQAAVVQATHTVSPDEDVVQLNREQFDVVDLVQDLLLLVFVFRCVLCQRFRAEHLLRRCPECNVDSSIDLLIHLGLRNSDLFRLTAFVHSRYHEGVVALDDLRERIRIKVWK